MADCYVTAIIIVIVIVTSSYIPDRYLTADRGVRDTRTFTDRDILDTPFVDKDRITTDSHVSRSIVYIVNSNVTCCSGPVVVITVAHCDVTYTAALNGDIPGAIVVDITANRYIPGCSACRDVCTPLVIRRASI
jgi:hypothetical protein